MIIAQSCVFALKNNSIKKWNSFDLHSSLNKKNSTDAAGYFYWIFLSMIGFTRSNILFDILLTNKSGEAYCGKKYRAFTKTS